ncbi:hypothetical protein [Mesorhizobium sp. CAU 1741]|uniref:hypothetical protein n=1 Tax=Mesorhizobium sp. CAU 1741 TaxID=3140366 RepID=UPI00325B0357
MNAGHNSQLTPTERAALRMNHVRKLLDIADRLKPLMDERKTARANAKAEGFKLSEIDAALRLATMEDTDIFVAEIKELIDIARAFNALPPGEQGVLFPDDRPLDEKAFDAGKVAGLQGKNCEPPYDAGSEAGQRWIAGWHEGQRIMRDELQSAMEKVNASTNDGDELIQSDPGFPDGDPFEEAAE